MLNKAAFAANDGGTIAAAQAACTGSPSDSGTAISNAASALENFNNSGQAVALQPGFNPGSANFGEGKAAANRAFWDSFG